MVNVCLQRNQARKWSVCLLLKHSGVSFYLARVAVLRVCSKGTKEFNNTSESVYQ